MAIYVCRSEKNRMREFTTKHTLNPGQQLVSKTGIKYTVVFLKGKVNLKGGVKWSDSVSAKAVAEGLVRNAVSLYSQWKRESLLK